MLRLSQRIPGMRELHGVWDFSSDRDEQVRPAAEALRGRITGCLLGMRISPSCFAPQSVDSVPDPELRSGNENF